MYTCIDNYEDMQDNYVDMQDIYVYMQDNYVYMQDNYVYIIKRYYRLDATDLGTPWISVPLCRRALT